MESRIETSQRESDVPKVKSGVLQLERTQRETARLLRLTGRQVRRIQRPLEQEADGGIVHWPRGQPANRQLGGQLRGQVLETYQRELLDFGPTSASEVLEESS
jgi:hypothetical protein